MVELPGVSPTRRKPPPVVPYSGLHDHIGVDRSGITPVRGGGAMLAGLKARSPALLELDETADANYQHKARNATTLVALEPTSDWTLRNAEGRLADADRRVRLMQAEATQLDALRKQQLMAGEEEVLHLKRKLLDEWEAREREWELRKSEELRNMKMKEAKLEEQSERLRDLERRSDEQLRKQEETMKRRMMEAESENTKFIQQLESRMKRELRAELEPELRDEIERELTHKISNEVKVELQREFQRMCEAMRIEVTNARERLAVELERELEPQIEARLTHQIKAGIEQELHDTVLAQLRGANNATQLLKDELTTSLDDRDKNIMEATNLRKEVSSLQQELRQARSELADSQRNLQKVDDDYRTLDEEHRLLQMAASGVLQQARMGMPRNISPPRRPDIAVPLSNHQQPLVQNQSSRGPPVISLSPPPHNPMAWPPQLLPNGGVIC